jgi:hypothetical protein
MSKVLAHLRAQWAGFLALFLVIAGGTAYAANTVFSADIVNGEVKSVDIGDNQVLTADVRNANLTGADIKDQSGVDTCTHATNRLGELCVSIANEHHSWAEAVTLCRNLGLRLPSLGEAQLLAANYDLPDVDEDELFWTGDRYINPSGDNFYADLVDDSVTLVVGSVAFESETVCVTTPTN